MVKEFSASGKLMLFGEYLVLKGVSCLAIPLKFGQRLEIISHSEEGLRWESYEEDQSWFTIHFTKDLAIIHTTDPKKAGIVQRLLNFILQENPTLKIDNLLFKFNINFERKFGFGTSSTLISLLSEWSEVNAYDLLQQSFGGSGYDVAGAKAESAYFYTMDNRLEGYWKFPKAISKNLLFVYLGEKQSSDQEVTRFNTKEITNKQIYFMEFIMQAVFECKEIEEWEDLMEKSEDFLSKILDLPKVKELKFKEYPYSIKSLGAWGGDFVMASCRNLEKSKQYFKDKGYAPIYSYDELIKEN